MGEGGRVGEGEGERERKRKREGEEEGNFDKCSKNV